ncbi:hypothetical protein FHS09_001253 [Microbulbifer rhizosphaerae]|uniref:Uncharacterized protein n=1 Tax=Microbulbifer rhizosphaerae TaxID=1562603 RepID=A0A7W4Z9N7_9GAMM|nr:hypothetical protein [Microbulbifer rhizosphaerae]
MHWWKTINKAMNFAPIGAGQPTLRSGCRLWQR